MIAGPYGAQKTGCSHECPVSCDPVGARTQDLLLRRQLLYPAELPDQCTKFSLLSKFGCKGSDFICNNQIFAGKSERRGCFQTVKRM